MTPDEAEELLRMVGADRIRRSSTGEYIHFRCPFAPYKAEHANSQDKKPSGWVSLRTARPVLGCWTCTPITTPLVTAVETLNLMANGRYARAVDRARNLDENAGRVFKPWVYLPTDVTTDYLNRYRKPKQVPTDFLRSKGVTKTETIDAFKVGVDTKQGLILFPIINREQVIVGAQARQFVNEGGDGGKYFSFYPHTSKAHHLFGEHLLNFQTKDTADGRRLWRFTGKGLIVFEGPLDCMHAYDVGLRNVVALMGAKVSEPQMRLFAAYAKTPPGHPRKTVYFVLDPDSAGRAGAKRSVDELFLDMNPDIDVRICTVPKDPKQLTLSDFLKALNDRETQWQKTTLRDRLLALLQAGRRGPTRRKSPSPS